MDAKKHNKITTNEPIIHLALILSFSFASSLVRILVSSWIFAFSSGDICDITSSWILSKLPKFFK